MLFFIKFSKTKFDPDIHQNAPNCTIFKNVLGGRWLGEHAPEPPSKANS